MNWNSTMGVISTTAIFLPIAFILLLRLGGYRTFPALLAYLIISLTTNFLSQGYVTVNQDVIRYFKLCNNLTDAPLMLLFLSYFCTSAKQAQNLRKLILGFILFEIIIVAIKGLNKEAITIVLAPGLAIVFGICMYFFINQTKMAITHRKATGKAFISASLLFAYGCFGIIYLLFYVFETHIIDGKINQQYLADTYLVYFFVATLSSLLLCAGLIIESKRVQKLAELKLTRKELSEIYEGSEKAAPLRTAIILDFERD